MIKRVKLDCNGWPTEIDWKATRRIALKLKNYIECAPPDEVIKFDYLQRLTPLIEATIDGTIVIPFPFVDLPYNSRYIIEGLSPQLAPDFSKIYAEFVGRIRPDIGLMSLSTHESGVFIFEKYAEEDSLGNKYELCWFED